MTVSVRLKKEVKGFTLDVEWEACDGITVLLGYSGSGKSLTLQLIAGLMRPGEGFVRSGKKIFFDSAMGIDVPPHQRTFGYVLQEPALFPHMTVKENILYGAKTLNKTERPARVGEMIGALRLEGLEERLPFEISGGQRQRVAFARALIRRPDALLLDEPFSSLDNPIRKELHCLLKEIRGRFNIPVVLVTHDIIEAYSMADRILIYSSGRIRQAGSPAEIFGTPSGPEVKQLVDTEEFLKFYEQVRIPG